MSQVRATKQEAKTAEEANTCCKHRRLTESIAQSAVSACEHKRPKTSRLTMSSSKLLRPALPVEGVALLVDLREPVQLIRALQAAASGHGAVSKDRLRSAQGRAELSTSSPPPSGPGRRPLCPGSPWPPAAPLSA